MPVEKNQIKNDIQFKDMQIYRSTNLLPVWYQPTFAIYVSQIAIQCDELKNKARNFEKRNNFFFLLHFIWSMLKSQTGADFTLPIFCAIKQWRFFYLFEWHSNESALSVIVKRPVERFSLPSFWNLKTVCFKS